MLNKAPLLIFIAHLCSAFYNPESGEDWSLLKPSCGELEGTHDTVPFRFGFIVNPYVVNEDGEYEEPEHTTIPRSHTTAVTTTFTTSYITAAPKPTKEVDVHQIGDGQIQRQVNSSSDDEDDCEEEDLEQFTYKKRKNYESDDEDEDCDGEVGEERLPVYAVACSSESALSITLENGILMDSNDRIGSIVSSHQFQFDGPVPQHGTIYAAGWSITKEGRLALGDSTKFYQCASGEFYNLYDEPIGYQCAPVTLEVVELIDC